MNKDREIVLNWTDLKMNKPREIENNATAVASKTWVLKTIYDVLEAKGGTASYKNINSVERDLILGVTIHSSTQGLHTAGLHSPQFPLESRIRK